MKIEEIVSYIKEKYPEAILAEELSIKQPWIQIDPAQCLSLAEFLLKEEALYFDFLHCISGVDLGPKEEKMEVVYHLSSLIHEHQLVLKIEINRANPEPIPSVSSVWRAANWHEREAYDLLGIPFAHHPDLRRILLPEDWEGHPLRKDYQEAETYHGIKIKY
ncbi:MAG: NADH-quinone oxidoreductase subunit C [Bacteroidota bacterium]